MKDFFSIGDLFNRTEELILWLLEKGVTTANFSRVSEYRKLAKAFFEMKDPTSPDAANLFNQLSDSIYEFIGLIHIKDTFEHEKSKGFLERLEKAHKGQVFFNNAKDGESRNFLFELLIASFFANKGYILEFNNNSDVVAIKDGTTIYIECKKCYSLNKVEKNLKKAHEQLLTNKTQTTSSTIGLVAIDISNLTSEQMPKVEFPDTQYALGVIDNSIACVINKIAKYIDSFNDKHIDTTLGTIVYSSNVFWLADVTSFFYTAYRVKAAPLLEDNEFARLNTILA